MTTDKSSIGLAAILALAAGLALAAILLVGCSSPSRRSRPMTVTPEGIEVLELEADAIRDAQPAAAAFLERVVHATGQRPARRPEGIIPRDHERTLCPKSGNVRYDECNVRNVKPLFLKGYGRC